MSHRAKWIKRVVLLLLVAAATGGIAASLRPAPILVEVQAAVRGPLVVTVDGMGKTRMVERQTFVAPVGGELVEIALRPGDAVDAGQVVAEILPASSQPLDARSRAEVTARLGAARAGLAEAQRNVERAQIALDLAASEAERTRKLHSAQSAPARALELAEAEERARRLELKLARTTVERARLEAQAVAAALGEPSVEGSGKTASVAVRATRAGVVLRVHHESAGLVAPGTPLLDIGEPGALELVVDLPTQSAVRIGAGAKVLVDGLGNGATLTGTVKLVEPAAFTKVTALGVEEQRVNVIVVPAGDPSPWAGLGDGFAVDAHLEVYKAGDVLKVPSGAVFRHGGGFAVFGVDAGRARLVSIDIGRRSATEVEVRGGLEAGAKVVVHPSDKIKDGAVVVAEEWATR